MGLLRASMGPTPQGNGTLNAIPFGLEFHSIPSRIWVPPEVKNATQIHRSENSHVSDSATDFRRQGGKACILGLGRPPRI
jgi:hypothetical protein